MNKFGCIERIFAILSFFLIASIAIIFTLWIATLHLHQEKQDRQQRKISRFLQMVCLHSWKGNAKHSDFVKNIHLYAEYFCLDDAERMANSQGESKKFLTEIQLQKLAEWQKWKNGTQETNNSMWKIRQSEIIFSDYYPIIENFKYQYQYVVEEESTGESLFGIVEASGCPHGKFCFYARRGDREAVLTEGGGMLGGNTNSPKSKNYFQLYLRVINETEFQNFVIEKNEFISKFLKLAPSKGLKPAAGWMAVHDKISPGQEEQQNLRPFDIVIPTE